MEVQLRDLLPSHLDPASTRNTDGPLKLHVPYPGGQKPTNVVEQILRTSTRHGNCVTTNRICCQRFCAKCSEDRAHYMCGSVRAVCVMARSVDVKRDAIVRLAFQCRNHVRQIWPETLCNLTSNRSNRCSEAPLHWPPDNAASHLLKSVS